MMNKKTMLVVGGDLRQVCLANRFSSTYDVVCFGLDDSSQFEDGVTVINNLEDIPLISRVSLLILPVPATENENFINAPFYHEKISAENLISKLPNSVVVFGGKISKSLSTILDERGILYYDYLKREELAVSNAVPTAEGAIQIIMEELPVTIFGLSSLIIGAGRISKVLRKLLTAMGAKVTVSARKCSDLAWIEAEHCSPVHNDSLKQEISKFDLIVNTVPATILTEDILKNVNHRALLLDLASKPGGIDFDVARRLGLKTIWALSIPGKVAPLSAGEIVYNTVCNILAELNSTSSTNACFEYLTRKE